MNREHCPSEYAGGVMGHIAKSANPPSRISYNFDSEVRNGKRDLMQPKHTKGLYDMWVNKLDDGREELWIGNRRLRFLRRTSVR